MILFFFISFREMIAYDELQISELKIENPTTSQRNPIASQHNRTASLYRTVLA